MTSTHEQKTIEMKKKKRVWATVNSLQISHDTNFCMRSMTTQGRIDLRHFTQSLTRWWSRPIIINSQRHHIPSVTDCSEREKFSVIKEENILRFFFFFWSNYSHDDVTVLKFQKNPKNTSHEKAQLQSHILPHIHSSAEL